MGQIEIDASISAGTDVMPERAGKIGPDGLVRPAVDQQGKLIRDSRNIVGRFHSKFQPVVAPGTRAFILPEDSFFMRVLQIKRFLQLLARHLESRGGWVSASRADADRTFLIDHGGAE